MIEVGTWQQVTGCDFGCAVPGGCPKGPVIGLGVSWVSCSLCGRVQADGECQVKTSYPSGRMDCVIVGVSVEVVVPGTFRHPSCCRVGGSAQPDPSCGSGVGRKRKKSGKAGMGAVEVRRGVEGQYVASFVMGVLRSRPKCPEDAVNHLMPPPVPCTRFPAVGPLLS